MVNHEGKANRRFQRHAQVRIVPQITRFDVRNISRGGSLKRNSGSIGSKADGTTGETSIASLKNGGMGGGLLSAGRNDILPQWIKSLRLRR